MMDRSSLLNRFEEAKQIAKRGAEFLLSHESMRTEITAKAENDFVTSADKECERLIISSILSLFPSDGVYGEESGKRGSDSDGRWIIDPIDGTVDFMASFPNYTISIAFEDEEGLCFGVVMVPRQNELFSAFRGEGAFLNGKRIFTDEKTETGKTLAILVPPHRHHELLHGYIERMEKFYYLVSDMRSLGSAAISLCYVACGRCSMYYELGLHIYDMAAGLVILKEAGGRYYLDRQSEDWIDIAASSAVSFDKMMGVVNG